MIKNAQEYWQTVERWTTPSSASTVRIGRRNGVPYYIQSPNGRSAEELTDMIDELRAQMDLGPND